MRRRAVPLLLSLCYASSAASLGLGELEVRSSLGQPLHATVSILEPESFGADCFRVLPSEGGPSAPLRAQLALERARDTATLHVRTRQAIAEPFVQFVLAFECGPNLRRDYVVLLDPPAAVEAPATVEAPESAGAGGLPAAPVIKPPEPPRRPLPGNARRLARATPALPAVPRTARAQPRQNDDQPRLVLSGRRMASQPGGEFALKLDTSLPDLNRTAERPLTETELSDENTALTRKLAHLESQLVQLQRRNAELEARRVAAPAAAPEPASGRRTWPLVLLGLAIVMSLAGLVAWLRQRSRARVEVALPAPFPEDWSLPPREQASDMVSPDLAADAVPDAPAPAQARPDTVARVPEFNKPLPEEMTEVKDDILDQAEVYMAHGHSDLAIHLLQEHLREAPTESPIPWLLLLDLLHRDGDLDGYAAAVRECRKHFNINLADHPAANQAEQGDGLEAYPHLLDRLTQMWQAPDVDAFFQDLIYDDRGGTRMGFAPAAYREILLLRAIAQDVRAAA